MNISTQLIIIGISFLPIVELRGAIPVAMAVYKMSIWSAYFWSVFGSLISILLVMGGLDLIINKFLIRKIPIFDKFFGWLFERTKKKHSKLFERWRDFGLVVWAAIPLPGFGVWTGALIAFVFGISIKRAFPLIGLGTLVAGVLVSLITIGIIKLPI